MSFANNKGNQNRNNVIQVYTNDAIKAPNIMIIDENWTNLWTFPRMKAMEMKDEAWLDLVQISYDRDKMLSTVKLVDYWKYMYQKSKDEKEKKKKQITKDLKEITIKYNIWENDLEMKINQSIKFLKEWHNVKRSIKLKWREKIYTGKALEKLIQAISKLKEYCKNADQKPKEIMWWYNITLFAK